MSARKRRKKRRSDDEKMFVIYLFISGIGAILITLAALNLS